MVSGGHGSTTSASRSWSRSTRRAGGSRASQPWTTWPRPPAGLCLEPVNKALTLLTRASCGATKPKTSQDADGWWRERGSADRASTDTFSKKIRKKVGFHVYTPRHFKWAVSLFFSQPSVSCELRLFIFLQFGSLILLACPLRSARTSLNQFFHTYFLDIPLHNHFKCFFLLRMYK